MISNISVWEKLILEMERPGGISKGIYMPEAPENIHAVLDTTVIGVEESTDSSPNDDPRAIWLSLGLLDMSEPAEGAFQDHGATSTGLLHCGTSSSNDNKPYGWVEGTGYSSDVSKTNKKRTMARKSNKKRRTRPPLLTSRQRPGVFLPKEGHGCGPRPMPGPLPAARGPRPRAGPHLG